MTIREWLALQMDNLLATVFIAVIVAALVGFYKRSTGMAVFVACATASMVVLLAYPLLSAWGWEWQKLVPGLGLIAGLCSVALFKIAIKFSERLEARDQEIADNLVTKAVNAVPGIGKDVR